MEAATNLIKKYFPNIMAIPVLGNHDMTPSNSFPDFGESELYFDIFNLWKEWIGEEAKAIKKLLKIF
jgi:hypothetical protein